MKLECSIEKIRNALVIANRISGKNLTLPVLSSVLWITEKNNLILRSTNLNIGIELKIKAKTEEDGIIAVKSDTLSSLFQVLQGDLMVSFETQDNNLKVKTKTNSILLKSIPHEDFPTIPKIVGEELLIPANKLVDGLKSVYYSASLSEVKPEIGSVYIYPQDDMLVFVSTDSFRLAEKRVKVKQRLSFDGVLIPYKNVVEIIKVFEGLNEEIKVVLQKNQISFETSDIYLTSRVVDGAFPDYKQIIPKEYKTEVIVLKQDLISSLKISNIFSDKFNQITFLINPVKKEFKIDSKNIDIGENITNLTSSLSGEDVVVNFNYKYLVDCFQSISADSLVLKLDGGNKPMIIQAVGDNSFMYLVMPMNR